MTTKKKKILSDAEIEGGLKVGGTLNIPIQNGLLATNNSGDVTADASIDLDELHTLDGIDKTQTIQTQLTNLGTRITNLDDAAVHKTGNETIDGYKTFVKKVTFQNGIDATDTTNKLELHDGTGLKVTAPTVITGDTSITGATTVTGNLGVVNGNITLTAGADKKITADTVMVDTIQSRNTANNAPVTVRDILKVTQDTTIGENLGQGVQGHANLTVYGSATITDGIQTAGGISQTAANTTATLRDTTADKLTVNTTSDLKGATTVGTVGGTAADLRVTGNILADGTVRAPIIDVNTKIVNTDTDEPVLVDDALTVTSGKVLSTSNITGNGSSVPLTITGNTSIVGTAALSALEVAGTSDLKGDMTIGTAQTGADLTVNGDAGISGKTTTGTLESGAATFTGTITATGQTVDASAFTGNSATTSKLQTAVSLSTIDSASTPNESATVSFDGSASVKIPLPTTIEATLSGNASTATKLAAAKNINGTAFDGSADITTSKWGTSRTVTIEDNDGTNTQANTSIDGSADITLKLPSTIKASLSGNASTASALTTSAAGDSTHPVYFSSGIPVQCDGTIANDISGTAATATNYNTSTGTIKQHVDTHADSSVYGHVKFKQDINGNTTDTTISEKGIRDFVNSSIGTATANFIGTFKALADSSMPAQKCLDYTQAQLDLMKDPYADPSTFDPPITPIETKLGQQAYGEVAGYEDFTQKSDYIDHYVYYNGTMTLVTSSNADTVVTTAGTTVAYDPPSPNDYCFVEMDYTNPATSPDEYRRYKFDGSNWGYEYTLNNSSFTQAQWNAIDSGITSALVSKLNGIETGAEVNVQADWNQTSDAADDYIKNKPTIGSANLTIQGGGTTATTFSANATSAVTLNIIGSTATTVSKTADNEITVSSPNLSLGTQSGTGDIVTDVAVSNHQITLTKGLTKVTSWSSTVSDTNIPSEKLTKDTLDTKQATLVSGTNIKTINSSSILASGNLDLLKSDCSNAAIDVSGGNAGRVGQALLVGSGGTITYGEAGKVDDVRINGDQPANSIVTNKIAVIPIAVTAVEFTDWPEV